MQRILVIEDNEDLLELLVVVLTNAGYEVTRAINGREGVSLYRLKPFDLVLSDLFMPEKDGLQVVMELRKDFPEAKIITISGGGIHGHSSLKTSKLLGAASVLPKPFEEADLLQAVSELLESS